jgi:hypothetical protein
MPGPARKRGILPSLAPGLASLCLCKAAARKAGRICRASINIAALAKIAETPILTKFKPSELDEEKSVSNPKLPGKPADDLAARVLWQILLSTRFILPAVMVYLWFRAFWG